LALRKLMTRMASPRLEQPIRLRLLDPFSLFPPFQSRWVRHRASSSTPGWAPRANLPAREPQMPQAHLRELRVHPVYVGFAPTAPRRSSCDIRTTNADSAPAPDASLLEGASRPARRTTQ